VDLEVTLATPDDATRLAALLQLYVYDFSEMLGLELDDDGRFVTPRVDGRLAFLARTSGRLAGFALIQQGSRLSEDRELHDVAEFFVLRRHRRHGVGEAFATRLFARFPGVWEVRQRRENAAATRFWRRVIARYTGGDFEDLELDDARWRGPVQRFVSR
jgi:predicted acetyltransferase